MTEIVGKKLSDGEGAVFLASTEHTIAVLEQKRRPLSLPEDQNEK